MVEACNEKREKALEVDQLSRVFDVSTAWLNRMIDRKPKCYLHVVQDVALVIGEANPGAWG
ncbi:hypothetical protein Rhsp01_43640 [Rhizobium sp. NBRC 114257]|uniref:Uncharacterized protein n=1 Tax=Rhizobium dioscoreae TaxID=2653122 RepID=A0ABQ0ZA16_9HYPH|nr:hypothetical protein RsS93_47070 [Rhizobium dioscoreae]GLU83188.1 hypothetical protein Rhsp01_43640 [Rhizobium sp. NBRC 114257]